MNIVLSTLNAKFIHSSLALRSLKSYAKNYDIKLMEFTINTSKDTILSELFDMRPDILGFSCYIWNIDIISELISILKKILPNIIIIVGGPEASYDTEYLLNLGADYVVAGEGEEAFLQLVKELTRSIEQPKGVIVSSPVELDSIPFVYSQSNNAEKNELDIQDLQNKIIYYETSRGCPYCCRYCLSSSTEGVRFLGLDRIFRDLKFFLQNKIKQVKFTDRTFNANKKHSLAIWKFLIENDNKVTNFHFEISADLLDQQCLEVLNTAPEGLFQFEVGVQSTNEETLRLIERRSNLQKLFENIEIINKQNNIHLHLDLIAGLPGETYESFKRSFNDVFALNPQQLQLGFLKLLKGSGLRENADKFGIVYCEKTPYEVLYTKDISFEEILGLKGVEGMVDIYYNSGQFFHTLKYLIPRFSSPFDFFHKLFLFYKEKKYNLISHSKVRLYALLYEFVGSEIVKELLRFDLFLNENIKNLPGWIEKTLPQEQKNRIRLFYNDAKNVGEFLPRLKTYTPRQLARMCHIESFDYDISAWIQSGYTKIDKQEIYLLFDYSGESRGVKKALNADFTKIEMRT